MNNKYINTSCFAVTVITLAMATVLSFITASCSVKIEKVGENASNTKKEFSIDVFDKIDISGYGNVTYVVSDTLKVEAKSSQDLLNNLEVNTENGLLKVRIIGKTKDLSVIRIGDVSNTMDITIYGPSDICLITLNGSSSFTANDTLKGTRVAMYIIGSGSIKIDAVECESMLSEISGSGTVEFGKVTASDTKFCIAGSGDIRAKLDNCIRASANIAGSGDIELSGKTEQFERSIAGSGNINTDNLKITNNN